MAKDTTEKTQQTDKPGWQSRIVGTGEEAPDQLLANPRNWRIHPQAQQEGLEAVLDRVGWVQNVVVNRRTGFLVDGHLRVTLAMRRGEAKVPVVYVDLTAEEEDLVLATMDPLAGLAGTDASQLESLLDGIEVDDPALKALLDSLSVSGWEPDLETAAKLKPEETTLLATIKVCCAEAESESVMRAVNAALAEFDGVTIVKA